MASMIISTYAMFLSERTSLFCLIVLCVGFFGIFIPYQERKKKRKQAQKRAPKQAGKPKRTTAGKTEDQKQLEQLKTLKTAGIISNKEYQKRKKELQRQ